MLNQTTLSLLKDFRCGAPASESAIRDLLAALGVALPEDYMDFLRTSNGAAGDIGPKGGFLRLDAVEELIAYSTGPFLEAGLLLIGSDGGELVYALDLRDNPATLTRSTSYGPRREYMGANFEQFLQTLASGKRPKKPAAPKATKKKPQAAAKPAAGEPGLVRQFRGHPYGIQAIDISPDGQRAITVGASIPAHLWDLFTGKELARYEVPDAWICAARITTDGRALIAAGGPEINGVEIHDVVAGKKLADIPGPMATSGSTSRRRFEGLFTPDGALFAYSHYSGGGLWTTAGEKVADLPLQSNDGFHLALSPDGKALALGSLKGRSDGAPADHGGIVRLLDLKGRPLHQFEPTPNDIIELAFVSSTRMLLCDGVDAILWDIPGNREVLRVNQAVRQPVAITPIPGRPLFATGTSAGSIHLFDINTGEEIRQFESPKEAARYLAPTPDGTHLLSAGFANVARLWRL